MAQKRLLSVLMVNQNPALIWEFKLSLERDRFLVAACDTATRAIQLLTAFTFDVLVIDLLRSQDDGFALANWCRRTYPTIQVMALVEDDSHHIKELCSRCGIRATLQRPFDPETIVQSLQLNPTDR